MLQTLAMIVPVDPDDKHPNGTDDVVRTDRRRYLSVHAVRTSVPNSKEALWTGRRATTT
jgi:hypothetical protein